MYYKPHIWIVILLFISTDEGHNILLARFVKCVVISGSISSHQLIQNNVFAILIYTNFNQNLFTVIGNLIARTSMFWNANIYILVFEVFGQIIIDIPTKEKVHTWLASQTYSIDSW